jgi:hypothetical protein
MAEDQTPNPRRQEAGRRNGAKGKGRKTPEGRVRSAQNALKHGLSCSQPKVIIHEEEPAFRLLRKRFIAFFQPRNQGELLLVESIVEAKWAVERAEEMERQIINLEILTMQDEMRAQHMPSIPIIAVRVGAYRGAIHRDRTLEYAYRAKVLNERNYHRRIDTYLKLRNLDLNPNDIPELELETQPEAPEPATQGEMEPIPQIIFHPQAENFSYKTKVTAHQGERTEPIPKQPLKAMTAA